MLSYFLFTFCLLQLTWPASGLSIDEELTLTFKEKIALDMFREKISPRLTQEYMSREIYLIRWLRDTKFNSEEAERKLLNHLEWRKVNKIDTIEEQDWAKIESNYPYTTDVYDRDDRPTFVYNFRDWDTRRAAVTGQTQKIILYWAKVMEELMSKVRQFQKEGRNVTQCNFMIDVGGYSLVQHGCAQCYSVYVGLISLLREHYPGDVHKVTLVNAPRLFELLLQALRPVMGPTGDMFKVFGTNRNEWKNYLLEDFSEDELPLQFGGTKVINEI